MKIKDYIGSPPTMEAIEAFENSHGIRLPDDYKGFLACYNGGRPEKDFRVFTFQKEDGATADSLVDWFSGLIESDDYSLEEDFEIYADRIPQGMLAIACDPFGNLILLGVRDSTGSGVWFWDHEKEPTSTGESGIYRIAESFEGFIESLTPIPS
jgi:hypothetical protein